MTSGPNASSNPYQAPAEAIDFVEASESKPKLSSRTIEALRETRPWVKLVAILGLLAGGMNVLGGFFGMVKALDAENRSSVLFFLGLRTATGVLYCIGSVLLMRYVSSISDVLISRHVDLLDAAIEAQKSFWRFVGVSITIALILVIGGMLLFLYGAGVSSLF